MCPHLCLLGRRKKTSLPTCGEIFSLRMRSSARWLEPDDWYEGKDQTNNLMSNLLHHFPINNFDLLITLSFKSYALSHSWFQNNMFHSYLMHSWKQLLVKICVVGKAEEVSVSNNQKFTTFWKTCFNFPRLRRRSMSFSEYILDVLGPIFLTPHCLYWRLHETLIWPGLIKAGYHLTIGANFVILVKSVS